MFGEERLASILAQISGPKSTSYNPISIMAALRENKTLSTLRNGKTVCSDHHLRVCNTCCLDLSCCDPDEDDRLRDGLDPEDSEQEDNIGDRGNAENLALEDDARVFILSESIARFIPQWDDQIIGPANTIGLPWYHGTSPTPHPPSSLAVYGCGDCHLRWLVGKEGFAAASHHPSHHTYFHEYAGTRRSLLVNVDGACSSNGSLHAQAGIGVFFASDSPYNVSEPLHLSGG